MSLAIRMQEVSVARGEKTLLRGINLDVAEGDFVAVVGPNGSGKTTLLKTLLGLADPFDGRIDVMGEDARLFEPRARAAKVAWLPQKDFTAEPMAVLGYSGSSEAGTTRGVRGSTRLHTFGRGVPARVGGVSLSPRVPDSFGG